MMVHISKFLLSILVTLLIMSCNMSDTSSAREDLPPPPDTPPKYIIEYDGAEYKFYDSSSYNKFLDSLGIKDTIVGRIM